MPRSTETPISGHRKASWPISSESVDIPVTTITADQLKRNPAARLRHAIICNLVALAACQIFDGPRDIYLEAARDLAATTRTYE